MHSALDAHWAPLFVIVKARLPDIGHSAAPFRYDATLWIGLSINMARRVASDEKLRDSVDTQRRPVRAPGRRQDFARGRAAVRVRRDRPARPHGRWHDDVRLRPGGAAAAN